MIIPSGNQMGGRQDSPSARYCTCQNVMNAEPATGGGGVSFQNVYVGASSTSVTFGGFGGSEHMCNIKNVRLSDSNHCESGALSTEPLPRGLLTSCCAQYLCRPDSAL